jgi:regulator of replication initiation timing
MNYDEHAYVCSELGKAEEYIKKLEAENELLNKIKQNRNELVEMNDAKAKEIDELKRRLMEAVKIIKELQAMPDVPHLDDHFEFLSSLSDKNDGKVLGGNDGKWD